MTKDEIINLIKQKKEIRNRLLALFEYAPYLDVDLYEDKFARIEYDEKEYVAIYQIEHAWIDSELFSKETDEFIISITQDDNYTDQITLYPKENEVSYNELPKYEDYLKLKWPEVYGTIKGENINEQYQ